MYLGPVAQVVSLVDKADYFAKFLSIKVIAHKLLVVKTRDTKNRVKWFFRHVIFNHLF